MRAFEARIRFFVELHGGNARDLLIGLGGDVDCVQYSGHDGDPPYLMATVMGHLDPPRIAAFERVLFECAQPKVVIITGR